MTAKKRLRAFCPVCNWYLVKADHGVWLEDPWWWCHRCNCRRTATLREETRAVVA